MSGIKRLVLDVLIPITLPSTQIAMGLSKTKGVEGVDVLIQEVERKVETAKITIEGDNLDFEAIKEVLDQAGASLQSIDRITCGKRIVG
jgi:hypothetical protein